MNTRKEGSLLLLIIIAALYLCESAPTQSAEVDDGKLNGNVDSEGKNLTMTGLQLKMEKVYHDMRHRLISIDTQTPGWLTVENKYMYWVSEGTMTWQQAQYICWMRNARLASKGLREEKVYDFVTEFIVEMGLGEEGYWVGLNDIITEGNWIWSDNIPSTDFNTKWAADQPDNTDNEDCGMLSEFFGDLNDDKCYLQLRAICEYDL